MRILVSTVMFMALVLFGSQVQAQDFINRVKQLEAMTAQNSVDLAAVKADVASIKADVAAIRSQVFKSQAPQPQAPQPQAPVTYYTYTPGVTYTYTSGVGLGACASGSYGIARGIRTIVAGTCANGSCR